MKVEHLSLITTPVLLLKGDNVVSQGTGFYYVAVQGSQQILFLVTNYHVFSGSAPTEGKAPIGDNVIFYLHKDPDNPGLTKQIRFPIFNKIGKPIWLSSKEVLEADVAVIPIVSSLVADAKVFGISDDWTGGNVKLRPTSTITLIGYPYGFYDKKNCLPVWKTGSMASEPEMDFEGKPLLLVDVSAFPGMSGSPTFAIAHGAYEMLEGAMTVGHVNKFLGIFASQQVLRENKYLEEMTSESKQGVVLEQSLQLGHIWKAKLISDITKNIDVAEYEREILNQL